jgi:hypothetical protein
VVDEQSAERGGIRRVLGQDGVHLALVVQAILLESVGEEGTGRHQQRGTAGQGGEPSIPNEGVAQMNGRVAIGHGEQPYQQRPATRASGADSARSRRVAV